MHAQVGVLNRLVLKFLGVQPRDSGALAFRIRFK